MPSADIESIENAAQRQHLDLEIENNGGDFCAELSFANVPHMPRLEMIPLRHTKARRY